MSKLACAVQRLDEYAQATLDCIAALDCLENGEIGELNGEPNGEPRKNYEFAISDPTLAELKYELEHIALTAAVKLAMRARWALEGGAK